MNILESSCPLIRPISPTPSENEEDTPDGLFAPLIPEISMTTQFSSNDSEAEDEIDEDLEIQSPLSTLEKTENASNGASISTLTTTVIMTNAMSRETTTSTTTPNIPIHSVLTAKSFHTSKNI